MARPKGTKGISTPELMWKLFTQYVQHVKDNPILVQDYVGKDALEVDRKKERPLTMEGFENFVADIDDMPWSLDHYFSNKDGRYEDYVAICSRIRRTIRDHQIAGGMAGIYNPSITQRLNGLTEKVETKTELTGQINLIEDKPNPSNAPIE